MKRELTEKDDKRVAGFAMLGSAIAGLRVSVSVIDDAAGPTYTDGRTIFLTRSGWRFDAHLQIAIQAAMIAAGTLDAAVMNRLVGYPRIARRYLYLEARRAVRHSDDLMPRRLADKLAGNWLGPSSESPAQSLELACSRCRVPEAPESFGSIRPLKLVSWAGRPGAAPSAAELRDDQALSQTKEFEEKQETEESKLLRLFSNPLVSGSGPISSLIKTILGIGQQSSPNDAEMGDFGGADMPVSSRWRIVRRGINAVMTVLPESLKIGAPLLRPGARSYPEWDEYENRYKPNWSTVEEFLPARIEGRVATTGNLIEPRAVMYRSLARLGFSHEQHRHQRMGEHVNVDSLVRMMTALRRGAVVDERIYSASLRTKRDLGVLLLIDVSGSSGEGSADGRRVHDEQIKLGYQLARSLERLGDQVAMYGFQSWGRAAVRFLQVKTFRGRLDSASIERMAMLEPDGYTRTGAAVRHATKLLREYSGAPHKLLVLISDAFTYDDGYEGAYGECDTRRALQEARDQRLACVCISLSAEQESARLRHVFGTASSLRVDNSDLAAGRVGELFRVAIGSVAKRHTSIKRLADRSSIPLRT